MKKTLPLLLKRPLAHALRRLAPGLLILLLWLPATAAAQCQQENTAFKPGEDIRYDLYFNWKFIWKKVGTARFFTQLVHKPEGSYYRIRLVTGTAGFVDRFFRMRDTISSLTTLQMQPIVYRKAAAEGKNYYIDRADFSYSGNRIHVKLHQRKNLTKDYYGEYDGTQCVFDMLSIMARSRSWDASAMKPGDKIRFLMADGENVEPELILYRGKEVIKSKDGHSYRCLVFSFYEDNDRDRDRELIRFFITDDRNHLPIRLDMNLNFGSAKAFMHSVHNNRYPLDARVE